MTPSSSVNQTTLLVKLSSMGDVVHCFPALSEAAEHGHRFDWVVEEAFVGLAAMHPAVDAVIPFALRRWRRQVRKGLAEMSSFVRDLRTRRYERVVDAQGLLKSALVSRSSSAGKRFGLDAASAREPLSARFMTDAISVSWEHHAIDRLRLLMGNALGYEVDLAAPLLSVFPARAPSATDPVLLIHGTTWTSKEYPETGWRELAAKLTATGRPVELLSGSSTEHARAQRIASDIDGVAAIPPASLEAACQRLLSAALVIGVDSGLTHFAAVSGRPTIGLYGPTDASRTGVRGASAVDLAADFSCAPCLRRTCDYTGSASFPSGAQAVPACFAQLSAEVILNEASALLAALGLSLSTDEGMR